MSRLLFWIGFVILVVMAVRSKLGASSAPRQSMRRAPEPPAPRAESERMASCAHCGIYFPASESVRTGGRDYCCAAHAPK